MKAGDFADIVLSRDLLSARHRNGEFVHFTRQERIVLSRLLDNPGRLLRRDALVAAISDERDGRFNDRHIDFLINQLRRKLGDSVKAPRFIQTQYGEGYVWIGRASEDALYGSAGKLLTIGPVYGISTAGADALVRQLSSAIDAHFGERTAELGLFAQRAVSSQNQTYSLEVGMHHDGQKLKAALVLRQAATVLDTYTLEATEQAINPDPATLARAIESSMWTKSALPIARVDGTPTERPVWLKLHDAGMLLGSTTATWRTNAARLAEAREANPDDPQLDLLWALNLYTRLMQCLPAPHEAMIPRDEWREIEDEIETIALRSLPKVGHLPMMQLGVAKLLMFLNRGYLHMGRRIAEEVLQGSSSLAASFSMVAQAASLAGEIDLAVHYFEKGLELTERGSYFQIYMLFLEGNALQGAGDIPRLKKVLELIRDVAPDSYQMFQCFGVVPGLERTGPLVDAVSASPQSANDALRYLFNMTGRQFALRDHRRNIMKGLVGDLVDRFGTGVVPEEVTTATGLGR
jgi:DNA-binding winged helix-turn-helix (wHTH) protein